MLLAAGIAIALLCLYLGWTARSLIITQRTRLTQLARDLPGAIVTWDGELHWSRNGRAICLYFASPGGGIRPQPALRIPSTITSSLIGEQAIRSLARTRQPQDAHAVAGWVRDAWSLLHQPVATLSMGAAFPFLHLTPATPGWSTAMAKATIRPPMARPFAPSSGSYPNAEPTPHASLTSTATPSASASASVGSDASRMRGVATPCWIGHPQAGRYGFVGTWRGLKLPIELQRRLLTIGALTHDSAATLKSAFVEQPFLGQCFARPYAAARLQREPVVTPEGIRRVWTARVAGLDPAALRSSGHLVAEIDRALAITEILERAALHPTA